MVKELGISCIMEREGYLEIPYFIVSLVHVVTCIRIVQGIILEP